MVCWTGRPERPSQDLNHSSHGRRLWQGQTAVCRRGWHWFAGSSAREPERARLGLGRSRLERQHKHSTSRTTGGRPAVLLPLQPDCWQQSGNFPPLCSDAGLIHTLKHFSFSSFLLLFFPFLMGFVPEQTYSQWGPAGRGQTRVIRQNGDRRILARRRERGKAQAMNTGLSKKGGASIGCNPREIRSGQHDLY